MKGETIRDTPSDAYQLNADNDTDEGILVTRGRGMITNISKTISLDMPRIIPTVTTMEEMARRTSTLKTLMEGTGRTTTSTEGTMTMTTSLLKAWFPVMQKIMETANRTMTMATVSTLEETTNKASIQTEVVDDADVTDVRVTIGALRRYLLTTFIAEEGVAITLRNQHAVEGTVIFVESKGGETSYSRDMCVSLVLT